VLERQRRPEIPHTPATTTRKGWATSSTDGASSNNKNLRGRHTADSEMDCRDQAQVLYDQYLASTSILGNGGSGHSSMPSGSSTLGISGLSPDTRSKAETDVLSKEYWHHLADCEYLSPLAMPHSVRSDTLRSNYRCHTVNIHHPCCAALATFHTVVVVPETELECISYIYSTDLCCRFQ
jgi:hypothetical protein